MNKKKYFSTNLENFLKQEETRAVMPQNILIMESVLLSMSKHDRTVIDSFVEMLFNKMLENSPDTNEVGLRLIAFEIVFEFSLWISIQNTIPKAIDRVVFMDDYHKWLKRLQGSKTQTLVAA